MGNDKGGGGGYQEPSEGESLHAKTVLKRGQRHAEGQGKRVSKPDTRARNALQRTLNHLSPKRCVSLQDEEGTEVVHRFWSIRQHMSI